MTAVAGPCNPWIRAATAPFFGGDEMRTALKAAQRSGAAGRRCWAVNLIRPPRKAAWPRPRCFSSGAWFLQADASRALAIQQVRLPAV